ncbi:MAG: hypothetical protein HQK81_01840 [Desulfovibrionaceae bacterium]|nr:hypothetical protein [Desulfovibrionaceae bacterium]MBF0512785.1 hypothetical protein [Desulfovibrionaceae bacterium]
MQELYTDGIMQLGFGRGAVRIDWFSICPDKMDQSGQPIREKMLRLITTPQGLVESLQQMQGLLQKLVEAGVVQLPQKPHDDAAKAEGGGPATPPVSPNFS